MKALDEALAKAGRVSRPSMCTTTSRSRPVMRWPARQRRVVPAPGFRERSSYEKFASGSVENLVNWLEGRPLVRVQAG
jgi:hypothetical protein